MLPQNFTKKSQEALQLAQQLALQNGQQSLEPVHLFIALLEQEDGVVPAVFNKLSIRVADLKSGAEQFLRALPRVSTSMGCGTASLYLSPGLVRTLESAERAAQQFKDEYLSTEHLLLGLLDSYDDIMNVIKQHGVTIEAVLQALKDVRGSVKVDSPEPEAAYQALEKYGRNLTAMARQDKLDPVIGRDDEIRRVMQILLRRTKNNPVLIGSRNRKTAILEGLAQRMSQEMYRVSNKKTIALDIGSRRRYEISRESKSG